MYIESDGGRGETKGHNYERPDFHQNQLLPTPKITPTFLFLTSRWLIIAKTPS